MIDKYNEFLNEDKDDDDDLDYLGDIDEDDLYNTDELDNLASLIRQMANSIGIKNLQVHIDDFDIQIEFILNKTEKINKLVKIMNFVKKLNSDILIEYDSEIDLWERKGNSILIADFYYNEGGDYSKVDDLPF